MPDEDREETLYHGTTRDVALEILATRQFQQQETYFASTRALAEFFAKRPSSKRAGHGPAVVRVVLYRSDLELWKRNRLVRSKGFDEGDQPSLYGKTQLVFSAEGITLPEPRHVPRRPGGRVYRSEVTPNPHVNLTAERRCRSVPVALRVPAAGYVERFGVIKADTLRA